jgi:phosphorylcholine metabolism protein LicD
MISSISHIFDLLNKNKIMYWLDAGTLLKGVRDADFLNSSDIDIAIKWEDHKKIINLTRELEGNGYKVVTQNSLPFIEDLYTIILPKSFKRISSIDIYIYHKLGDEWVRRSIHKPDFNHYGKYLYFLAKRLMVREKYRGGFSRILYLVPYKLRIICGRFVFATYEKYGKTSWNVVPEIYFAEFTSINIYDQYFMVPRLYEDYLQYRYGRGWLTPIKRELWLSSLKHKNSKFFQKRKLKEFIECEKHWFI